PPCSAKPKASLSASLRKNGVVRKPVPATFATASSRSRMIFVRESNSRPNVAANASHAKYR
ncbi:MAG: hypothetical protein ACK55Z_32780, partial [bacterium]